MQGLQANVRNSQLQKYLERFFIDDFDIRGIGPGRKSTLASFGIETARDVVPHRVKAIRGFGDTLTGELVEWRTALKRKFVFDQSKGIDPADIAAVNQQFSQKRKSLEGKLLAGYEQLTQIRRHILLRRQQLQSSVEAAARQLAQAEADLKILG
jgi:DNA-binding helix-hairpin-helix protein with protein kinase domain